MKSLVIAVFICVTSISAGPALSHEDVQEFYMTKGEVLKIDTKKQTVTLKHEPLAHLRMPAGTQSFPVKDPALLKKVKAGEKVLFAARNIQGTVFIRKLEVAGDGGDDGHTHAH